VEEVSRRGGASPDLVLAAIDQARPACKGTEWEKRLEDLRAKAQKDKETEDSTKDLSPLIDELKGAVATDTEFKRYSELQPKFQLAIETAGRTQSARMTEIRTLQRDYNSRYEKLAEPFYNEISEAANALAEERRYDDAIRKIDTFPAQFRNSGSWTVLSKLKQDIERRKKQLPPKK
jgi:Skp family chaperone for outer membrane proteins